MPSVGVATSYCRYRRRMRPCREKRLTSLRGHNCWEESGSCIGAAGCWSNGGGGTGAGADGGGNNRKSGGGGIGAEDDAGAQEPPTPLTDCWHISKVAKLQSSGELSSYVAQYCPCARAPATGAHSSDEVSRPQIRINRISANSKSRSAVFHPIRRPDIGL